jgi:GNAT superfamily N-acetyltransferase
VAETDTDIHRCHPVMRELRPHVQEANFVERVRRQMAQGYRLAFLEGAKTVRAVAGYRIVEGLAWGRFLYVDDLVTRPADQSKGYGRALFDWLVAEAAREGCAEFHLDSGVQRFGAHRFYLGRRMDITCHHFALKLPVPAAAV